jgi:hypothetical protein
VRPKYRGIDVALKLASECGHSSGVAVEKRGGAARRFASRSACDKSENGGSRESGIVVTYERYKLTLDFARGQGSGAGVRILQE